MSRPFIPAPHVASVEFIYTLNTVVAENQIHVLAATDFDDSMVAQLWDTCKAWWSTTYKQQISTGCTFNRLKVKAQHSDTAPLLDTAILPVVIGVDSQTPLSNNASFALKLATGLAGRSARGRWYVAGLTALHSNNGVTMGGAKASALVSALQTLINDLGGISMELCITSYRHNGAWRAEAVSYPVTGVSYTDLSIDSQRRRLAGRGK